MHNLTIETRRTVKCNFSADQWGLLTAIFPRDEIESIADKLNERLNDYVNEEYTRTETLTGMYNLMKIYRYYGTSDTEPHAFLEKVLQEIYK